MNGRVTKPWPDEIQRVIELGEGNGYTQPWESTRKGPSLLAELAEKTGKDIEVLTPGERIAFHIGWVRGRIKKYEEAGTIDPAEIAHARGNEQFYHDKLRQVLEEPPPSPTPDDKKKEEEERGKGESPPPEPVPAAALKEVHETPEGQATFARYLTEILKGGEREKFLDRLKGPSGRLWIDKKIGDKIVRIWLSLDLTPEEMAKPEKEINRIIEEKLQSMSLKVRIDDPSKGPSWKDRWTSKKNALTDSLQQLKNKVETKSDATATIEAIVTKLGITDEQKKKFTAFLQNYLKRDGAKDDIWTLVRNAYWHSEPWEADLTKISRDLGATFALPTYEDAKVKTWEKIDARTNALLTPTGRYTVKMQGKDAAEYPLAERREKDGQTSYHFVGLGWVQEDDLRICEKKEKQPDSSWKAVVPAAFELMAWRSQTEEPKGMPAASPPPVPKEPTLSNTAGEGKNIWEELKKIEGFITPTDEHLTEKWLKEHTGTKLNLKVHAAETPKPIPCMIAADQTKAPSGHIRLHYTHNGGRGNKDFNIADLRRLNLPPPAGKPSKSPDAGVRPEEIPSNNNDNTVISVDHLYEPKKGKVNLIHQAKIGDCVLIAFLNAYVLEHGHFPRKKDGKPMGVNDARALAVQWAREKGEAIDDIETPATASNISALNIKDAARLFSWIHQRNLQQTDVETIETDGRNIDVILKKLDTYQARLCMLGMGFHAYALKKIGDSSYVIVNPLDSSGGKTLNKTEVKNLIQEKLSKDKNKNIVIFVRGPEDPGTIWENPTMTVRSFS